jgi:hypothetical protein
MSGLYLTNGACQGWVSPTNLYSPKINNLSSTYSPAKSNTIVAIFGKNFYLYSTVKFGTYIPQMFFINSQQIDFYMPSSASPGTYTVQVLNNNIGSNIVEFTIYNSPGLWYENPYYSNIITNSNTDGLFINGAITINSTENNQKETIIGNLVFDDKNPSNINNSSNSSKQSISWPNYNSSIKAIPNGILINGNLNVTGTIINPMLSDYRVKDLIEPLNSSYKVDNLKPIRYYNKKTEREEIGFLAHEVQAIFPCLVTGEKDGQDIQTLNYIGLIGVLTNEIQILKAEVAELKNLIK